MDCGICTYTYELSSCCTLKFKVGDKEFVFNLEDTKVFSQNSSGIIIKDNTTTLALSNAELAAIPLTVAEIEAMICECRNQVLGGATTPDYEAGNYTLLCDSVDPNIHYLAYFTYNDGAKENHYITLPSGVDTIGNLPSTAIPCKDSKVITSCYTANGVLYTNIICLGNNSVISSLWLNMADNSVSQTMPIGAVPCKEKIAIAVEKYCATKQENSGTAYYLVYKGSYQDYINSGGNPNAIELGTFEAPYDGWLYAGICAVSLPNPVDNWEWSTITTPICGYNSGNQYCNLVLIPNGNTISCNLFQQKNIEKIKYSDDTIRWVEDNSDHSILIDFDITGWELLDGACPVMQEVTYVECNVEQTAQVEKVVGAYVLNNKYQHTEVVYDNVTATLGGTINAIVSGTNLSFDFSNIIATNWISGNYLVDFGNGYTDFGNSPSFDFINEPDGHYEVKIFRMFVYPDGTAWHYVYPIEINKVGSIITILTALPATVNRSITYTQKAMLQDFCGELPIGSPYTSDGSPATVNGIISLTNRDEKNEWLGVTDANNNPVSPILVAEQPNGITYTNNLAENNPQPSIAKSITLTKQSGGIVEVSFDSGATYPLRLVSNGSRTWGQGNQEGLNVGNMRFRQLTNGVYDLIWEI